jgi:hypothetical protein
MYSKRDYNGQRPCIEPHILGRVLDKLPRIAPRIQERKLHWSDIDKLAKTLQTKPQ